MAKKFDLIRRPLDTEELRTLRRLQKKISGTITLILLQIILENRYPPLSTEQVRKKIYQGIARSVNIKNAVGNLNQLLKKDQAAIRDVFALGVRIACDKSGIRRVFMARKRDEKTSLPVLPRMSEPREEELDQIRRYLNGELKLTKEIEDLVKTYVRPVYKPSYQKPQ